MINVTVHHTTDASVLVWSHAIWP